MKSLGRKQIEVSGRDVEIFLTENTAENYVEAKALINNRWEGVKESTLGVTKSDAINAAIISLEGRVRFIHELTCANSTDSSNS